MDGWMKEKRYNVMDKGIGLMDRWVERWNEWDK